MIDLYWLKFRHIFLFVVTQIMVFVISLSKRQINKRSLLIIRLDSIGDYILLRNFFKFLREDERYKNYKITLCGNIVWKDLAEHFDKTAFDNFIWLDRKQFKENFSYRYSFLKKIYKLGFEIALETTYSREILFGDSLVKVSQAKERIGCTGSIDKTAKWKRGILSDAFYTKLLPSTKSNLFEFYRNKEFFEQLLNKKLAIKKTSMDCSNIAVQLPTTKNFIVVFPGAQFQNRIWSAVNYAQVIGKILLTTDYAIVLAGSHLDKKIADTIVHAVGGSRIVDMTGKTTLLEMTKLVAGASLVIANETMGVHIAAAVNVPFVCISNGQHLGRFNPYPAEIFGDGYYIYPEQISAQIDKLSKLIEEYRFEGIHDINTIHPEKVMTLVEVVLAKIRQRNKCETP